jgi:hypothetical protein
VSAAIWKILRSSLVKVIAEADDDGRIAATVPILMEAL